MNLDRVPRCPGDLRNDGDVAAGQSVHQSRFAGVWRPGDHDRDAVADALARAGRRDLGLEGLKHGPHVKEIAVTS